MFKIPTAWNWNATVQRELPGRTTIEVGYVGRRGIHNQRKRNINQLLPGTVQANPGVNANALRPYRRDGHPRAGGELRPVHVQRTCRSALSAASRKGFQFDVAYTLSRLRDNASSLTEILPNAYSDKGYYGISDLDRTHVLIISYIYELPFRGTAGLAQPAARKLGAVRHQSDAIRLAVFRAAERGLRRRWRGQRKPVLEPRRRSVAGADAHS